MQVFWRIDNRVRYAMMQIPSPEMVRLKRAHPELLGIPLYWAIVDGEVEWYPQCLQGEPEVVLDPHELMRRK